jgi:uncharacterized protein (TIGR03435 family)
MFPRCMPRSVWSGWLLLILLVTPGRSAEAQAANRFSAADVHVSPDTPLPYLRGGLSARGTYELHFATMADLISIAWSLNPAKVAGGPSWLEWDRFDVIGKVPAGTTLDGIRQMLRALLSERFSLLVHNDIKPLPAFILSASSKLRMKPSSGGESGCKPDSPGAGLVAGPGAVPVFSFTCQNLTMEAFASAMPRMSGVLGYTNNLPVVDRTGLQGSWDFHLRYTIPGGETRYGIVPSAGELIPLPAALNEQLGLELKPGNTPGPILVVDSVNETPAPNPPGTAQALPTPPAEFDVAVLKPSDPGSNGFKFQVRNGSVDIAGCPLSALIFRAWNVSNPAEVTGVPGWADKARFFIVAKSSGPGPDPMPQAGMKADYDGTIAMLRRLLTDRFRIRTHYEDRPVNAYTLHTGKPKMKRADPQSRTSCRENPFLDAADPRRTNPAITRVLSCTNVTVAQFGKLLLADAADYVQSPVQDETGLEGGWDFLLDFSDAAVVTPGARRGDNASAVDAQAPAPNGGISLAEAISKQLGLKLELQKRAVRVLVIDHIDEKPITN